MRRRLIEVFSLLILMATAGLSTQARDGESFSIAVGVVGSASYTFGTVLWAVSELKLSPDHKISIKTVEHRQEDDRLADLLEGRSHMALVRADVPTSFARGLRSITVLWPGGISSVGGEAAQLLVRSDVSEEVVYQLTRTIFENAPMFRQAHDFISIGTLENATVGLTMPIHPGAFRYYAERRPDMDLTSELTLREGDSSQLFAKSWDITLQVEEARQFMNACQQAADHGILSPVENDDLTEACGAMGVHGYIAEQAGQGGPEIRAFDSNETAEAKNPRGNGRTSKLPGYHPIM